MTGLLVELVVLVLVLLALVVIGAVLYDVRPPR